MSAWNPAYIGKTAYVTPPSTNVSNVFGILSIVFSSLNGVGNALAIVQAVIVRSALAANMPVDATESFEQMRAMTTASSSLAFGQGIAMLVMDVVLLTIGILLLKRNDLGRRLAVGWAIAAFVVLVARAVAFEIVLLPTMAPLIDKFQHLSQSGGGSLIDGRFMAIWMRFGTYVSLLFMAVFPTCLLAAAPRLRRELAPEMAMF
jgi:hypothetical protein